MISIPKHLQTIFSRAGAIAMPELQDAFEIKPAAQAGDY